ncbi:DUF2147 domain-containing protein [Gymnodinialimonas sp.]
MKKTALAACVALLGSVGTASADAAHGVWQTEVDDGNYAFVTLAACGSAVCGTISRTFNASGEYQSENLGRQIVIDMVPNGDGTYEGSVWRPSNNRIYIGRMSLSGNSITLRGCVAGGLICARQNWVRVQ